MSEFYHHLTTKKSFEVLQQLNKNFDFILIGGWAVFVYTHSLKSKDIDIVVRYDQLSNLKDKLEVVKNERLKKYEANVDQVDIDIYLPHYSQIGFPVEEIENYTQNREGFVVPIPEVVIILKAHVAKERKGTPKGKKDLIDIFSLLSKQIVDWGKYKKLVKEYNLEDLNQELKEMISSSGPIPQLGLLNHQLAKIKREF